MSERTALKDALDALRAVIKAADNVSGNPICPCCFVQRWNQQEHKPDCTAAPLPAQEVTVTKGMRRGLVAAKILLANSIACVQQHHGAKAGDPLPPWLADCQRDIAALESALRPGKD